MADEMLAIGLLFLLTYLKTETGISKKAEREWVSPETGISKGTPVIDQPAVIGNKVIPKTGTMSIGKFSKV